MPDIGHNLSPDCEILEELRLLCVSKLSLKSERKKTLVSRFQDSVKSKTHCEGLSLNSIRIKKQIKYWTKTVKQ